MILLTYHPNNKNCNRRVILIFGLGLVGSSIAISLRKHIVPFSNIQLPYSWTDFDEQKKNEKLIIKTLSRWKGSLTRLNDISHIDFVWSAGKGGFNANKLELENEMTSFKNIIGFFEETKSIFSNSRSSFHMLSSAGGLFEGQCNVNINNTPNPKRPYGLLKLKQERYLLEKNLDSQKFIYRPSSIYGLVGTSPRLGLIPTLIYNAIQYKVSNIYGGMDTLRDYILASDIGDFVAKNIFHFPCNNYYNNVFTLATGKSSTISEIIHKIESVIGRKFYVCYEASSINSANNSYSQQILPESLVPTDLETGIRKTYVGLIGIKYGSL